MTSLMTVVFLVVMGHWFALVTGLIAVSPDAIGFYNYLKYERKGLPSEGILEAFHVKFHRWIQWGERPWGIVVESVATGALSWLLVGLI